MFLGHCHHSKQAVKVRRYAILCTIGVVHEIDLCRDIPRIYMYESYILRPVPRYVPAGFSSPIVHEWRLLLLVFFFFFFFNFCSIYIHTVHILPARACSLFSTSMLHEKLINYRNWETSMQHPKYCI